MKKILVRLMLGMAAGSSISLLSGCLTEASQAAVPAVAPPIAESAPGQCSGNPYWCVKVANEASEDVQVYLDGQAYKSIAGGQSLWVPFQAGSSHVINSCKTHYEGSLLFGKDVTKCTDPKDFTMDGNKLFVVHFTQ